MDAIDVDALLLPCTPEAPCGEDLEYDPAFVAAIDAGQADVGASMVGDAPEAEVDWAGLQRTVLRLFGRTKDLRLGVLLARCALQCHGFGGLRDVCQLLHALVERYWKDVHPAVDPEMGPVMRLNALRGLLDVEVLNAVRGAPIASLDPLGSVSFRDVATPDPDSGKPVATILQRSDFGALSTTVEAIATTRQHLTALQQAVNEKTGAGQGVSLDDLDGLLRQVHGVLRERVAERSPEGEPAVGVEPEQGAAGTGSPVAPPPSGQVASRADVLRALDLVCEYYVKSEPASPVPMLLRRAQRLVPMSFEEIIADLAPSANKEVAAVRGPEPK